MPYAFKRFTKQDCEIVEEIKESGEYKYIVNTPHGKCKTLKSSFNGEGRTPTIRTALDKNSFIKSKFRSVHEDKYDYSLVDYKNNRTKVKIICSKHGKVRLTPDKHLSGRGCPKCGNSLNRCTTNSWEYSDWEYSGYNYKNFKSFKVYIIRCWNDEEKFYKIGKTYKNVIGKWDVSRFRDYPTNVLPYHCEIYQLFESEDAKYISDLEIKLQNQNKKYKYKPKIKFGGMNECYIKIIKE